MMCRTCRLNHRWSPLEREVADELIRQHALTTGPGQACHKSCSQGTIDSCFGCYATRIGGTVSIGAILLALIAVIMLSIIFVVPHFKSGSFKPTKCTVVNVADGDYIDCRCGRNCRTQTVCVKVDVKYTRDDGKTVRSMLRITETQSDKDCTAAPCDMFDAYRNAEDARRTAQIYRDKSTFKCLYDPTHGSQHVIDHRLFNNDGPLIHMVVWPIVVMALGVVGLVFVSWTCGYRFICARSPPQDVELIAANLHMQGVYTLKGLPAEERTRLLRECAPEPVSHVPPQEMERGEDVLPQAI